MGENMRFFSKKPKEVPINIPQGNYSVKEENQKDNEIAIMPIETIRIHDLANMFPFNITPALIESKIQHVIAAKMKIGNKLTPQWAFLIIALMIGGVIAGYMAWHFFGQNTPEVIVRLGPGLERITSTVSGNLTG